MPNLTEYPDTYGLNGEELIDPVRGSSYIVDQTKYGKTREVTYRFDIVYGSAE